MTLSEKAKWQEIMEAKNGITIIYSELARQGVSQKKLVDAYPYVVKVLEMLPLLENTVDDEFHELFVKRCEALAKSKYEYEVKYQEIPAIKEALERRERALWNNQRDFEKEKSKWESEDRDLKNKEIELNKLQKDILACETPEGRDRIRLADIYLSRVNHNQWTDKAIAWSLGAILSGTQIPNFGKSE